MKKIIRTLVLATALVAMVGCGGSHRTEIDLDRVEAITSKGADMDEADYDELLDQFEALCAKYAPLNEEERAAEYKTNPRESEALLGLGLLFSFQKSKLTEQQQARIEKIETEYKGKL